MTGLGYTPPEGDAGAFYEGFEWDLPGTYNVADVALDAPDGDEALFHVDGGEARSFTYGDLAAAADAVAAALRDRGVERGDRVAVCLPTCPELLVAHLATYRLGAVVVPLSVILGEEGLAHPIDSTEPDVLVVDERTAASASGDALAGPERWRVTVGPDGYAEGPLGGLAARAERGAGVDPAATAPDDPALVLYTSGTSGRPKGVVQGHAYLAGSLPGYHCWFHLFDRESARAARVWSPSEWAWAGALFDVVFPTLALGGTVCSRLRRTGFDPEVALRFLERAGVSHAFFPPTAVGRVRAGGDPGAFDLSSLSVLMCGGEKLAPALRRWAEDALDCAVNETYGQTEANALAGDCQAAFPPREGAMGRPYPGHDVAVVDEDGDHVPRDGETLGEIAVATPDPVVFERYWGDPDATDGAFDDAGRLRTGDLASVDEEGYLSHAGRKDALVVTSGYRVSPLEVERALAENPAVAEAVVGGVPDEERGQRVKAYVVLADRDPDEAGDDLRERLRDLVRERLGAYKVPREIAFVEEVPETRSGKADRAALFGDRE
ncbi:MAG: acyl-CoA synthetase [Halobacteriaceae archaeon]